MILDSKGIPARFQHKAILPDMLMRAPMVGSPRQFIGNKPKAKKRRAGCVYL